MARSTREDVRHISLSELDDVLTRARDEAWHELALVGPNALGEYERYVLADWPSEHIFRLDAPLKSAAKKLAALTNLTSLNLWNNQIDDDGARALLDAWVDSPNAERRRELNLRGNGDLSSLLPPEVIETTDARAILAAYRRFRQADKRPLNEAKLLVVGKETVGKTSLVRYLIDDRPRNESEPATAGIDLREKIETTDWRPDGSAVKLNVWDFAGQEMRHGTHRYFLTERSLYLLVLEDRREDDRSVYDWLKTIRNRGGDSPVIVAINKCDEPGQCNLRLDEKGLLEKYPGIVAFVRTSCNANDYAAATIAELRKLVADTLADDPRLKHVRDPIPPAWLRVKQAVADLARDESVLEVRQFTQICQDTNPKRKRGSAGDDSVVERDAEGDADADSSSLARRVGVGITDENEQRALLRLLHDLGVVVAHGLSREALPVNEPDYEVWPGDALRFRYRYELLPPGLIPRFIVQSHRNLSDRPTRWKTGVVLQAEDCKILIRGDRDQRLIDIFVAGPKPRRRAALAVVVNDLEYVHSLNREIGEKAVVPLHDQPNVDVPYEHLLKLEARYGPDHEFHPEEAEREEPYTVRELLEGVGVELIRERAAGERGQRIHVDARNSTVLIAGRDANSRRGDVRLGTGTADAVDKASWRSVITSWRFFSVACGIGAMAIAVVLWLLPSNQWRAIVGGLLGLGLLVTVLMLSMNPRWFYRRLLCYVIPAGLLINALGFTVDVTLFSEPAAGWFRWDGTVSGWFFVAWAAVVGFLVWADWKQRQS